LWATKSPLKEQKQLLLPLEKNQSLTSLNLAGNQITDEEVKAIATALEKNQSLTSLDLQYNQITAEGAKAIAIALKKNQSLTSLNLECNKITAEGAKAIATALEKNQSLTSLSLGGNEITDEGAKAIATALKKNQSLSSLSLGGNEITAEGAKAIATALEKNQSLTSLDLYNNKITAEGVKAIATALEKNQSLTSLALQCSQITDEGAKAIAIALKKNQSLISLDLQNNRITSEGEKAIATALKKNQSLASLSLGGNYIPAEGAKAIAIALEKNQKRNQNLASLTKANIGSQPVSSQTQTPTTSIKEVKLVKPESIPSIQVQSTVLDSNDVVSSFLSNNLSLVPDSDVVALSKMRISIFQNQPHNTVDETATLISATPSYAMTEFTNATDHICHLLGVDAISENLIRNLLKEIKDCNVEIFLSYAWSEDDSTMNLVDEVERLLVENGIKVYRDQLKTRPDNSGLKLKTNIHDFMSNSHHTIFIPFINDAYLKSLNCMFEAKEALSADHKKIFPIIYPSQNQAYKEERDIFKPNFHLQNHLPPLQTLQ
jgi:Ran GTPase-activating protein (RanGAP) involved in mRNA processing and transport